MNRSTKKLGQILIDKKLISETDLESALLEQKESKEFLGSLLIRLGKISPKDLVNTLSEQFDLPVVSLRNKYIDWNFVRSFSSSLILDYRCFPVSKDNWSVTFAILNPLDAWAIKRAEEETAGLRVKLVLALPQEMGDLIVRYKQELRRSMNRRTDIKAE